jgi:long-chain fatty acid transport protein
MNTPFVRTRIATAVAGLALALGAGQTLGAGFILQENSGSGLGNAYAGGAAASEDADTVWTNPAGMSRLKTNQLALAINAITPSAKFSDNGGSKNATLQPLGGNGGDAGGTAWVPNFYLVMPLNQQWAVGVGVNAPFGLKTEYDSNWIGRYQAIESKIETINVNPAISYKLGDFAAGVGVNWQRVKGTFTSAVNYSALLNGVAAQLAAAGAFPPSVLPPFAGATAGLDALADNTVDKNAWGWNVGFEWNIAGRDLDYRSRLGVAYRSQIKYSNASGNANFSYPSAPANLPASLAPVYAAASTRLNAGLYSGSISTNITLPGFANVSYFHTMLNDKWDFMADAQYTNWSTIQDLTLVRTSGASADQTLSSTPLHFKNTWRVSGGANYRYTDQWMFRGGLAWDQSPVTTQYRTPRLPDADRIWGTLGVQYKWSPTLKFDLGGAYIWVKDSSIAQINTDPATVARYGYLSGNYSNYVWIMAVQGTWSF